jgi:hypothetical protein
METKSEKDKFIEYLKGQLAEGWNVSIIQLENNSIQPLKLVIEPLGDLIVLPPSARYEVVGQQPEDYGMHLEFSDKCIQGWIEGFSGVFHNGVAIETTYYNICQKRMQELDST